MKTGYTERNTAEINNLSISLVSSNYQCEVMIALKAIVTAAVLFTSLAVPGNTQIPTRGKLERAIMPKVIQHID